MSYQSTNTVSANNTPMNPELRDLNMVPLGASVWTSSGDLARQGITAIAHAASGAMGHAGTVGFDPTRESVAASIENSFLLANAHGYKRVAIPYIGGKIFFQRILPSIEKGELASIIVKSCQDHRGSAEAVIVVHTDEEMAYFDEAMKSNTDTGVSLVQGSITHYADHQCAAIVNAANMEVTFGGGLSLIIASATGQAVQINQEAAGAILAFWAANSHGEASISEGTENKIQVIGSIFKHTGAEGDFGWMIEQPAYADALFIFNDNEEQFLEHRKDPKSSFGCADGGGNAGIRSYQCSDPPRATGIPTGSFEAGGYKNLKQATSVPGVDVQALIDQALETVRDIVMVNKYQHIIYSADESGNLGTGIFAVGDEVKVYIAQRLRELGSATR